jgi:hypothetical protein
MVDMKWSKTGLFSGGIGTTVQKDLSWGSGRNHEAELSHPPGRIRVRQPNDMRGRRGAMEGQSLFILS